MTVFQLAALIAAILACVCDVTTRRIPNVLTFSTAAAALVFHGVFAAGSGVAYAAGGLVTGLLLFLPFFLLRGMGGGDVKLLAALGAWVGPGQAVKLALFAALAGGPLALAVVMWRGYGRTVLGNVWSLLMFWRVSGMRPHPTLTLEAGTGPRLPYAIPIAVGLVATIWLT